MCWFFDESTKTWQTTGVTWDGTEVTDWTVVRGNTLHFTSFSVSFSLSPPVFNTLSLTDFSALTWANIKRYPAAFIATVTLSLLYIIVVICLIPYDANFRYRFADLLLSSDEVSGLPPVIWETWVQPDGSAVGSTISRSSSHYRISFIGRNEATEGFKPNFQLEVEREGRKMTSREKKILNKLKANPTEKVVILQMYMVARESRSSLVEQQLDQLCSVISDMISCDSKRLSILFLPSRQFSLCSSSSGSSDVVEVHIKPGLVTVEDPRSALELSTELLHVLRNRFLNKSLREHPVFSSLFDLSNVVVVEETILKGCSSRVYQGFRDLMRIDHTIFSVIFHSPDHLFTSVRRVAVV